MLFAVTMTTRNVSFSAHGLFEGSHAIHGWLVMLKIVLLVWGVSLAITAFFYLTAEDYPYDPPWDAARPDADRRDVDHHKNDVGAA